MLSHIKTTTVRELRNHYTRLLGWVAAGEEVQVTQRGKVVARLLPPSPNRPRPVDWSESAALKRRPGKKALSAAASGALLADSQDSR